jgi:hypothetical protein
MIEQATSIYRNARTPPEAGIDEVAFFNSDYCRDLVRYQTEQSSIASLWLAVMNEAETAVRDVHMEMCAK